MNGLSIMSNIFLNENIFCDNQDPPLMNRHIKILMLHKENFYKAFVPGKNMFHLCFFNDLQNDLNQFI